MYRTCLLLMACSLSSLVSCSSSQFIPGEAYLTDEVRDRNCDLKYFTEFPNDDYTYDLVGTCIGKGRKGIIKNDYENAHKMIEQCACENGANAVVFVDSWAKGYYTPNRILGPDGRFVDFGPPYRQTIVEMKAYVIYLKDDRNLPSSVRIP